MGTIHENIAYDDDGITMILIKLKGAKIILGVIWCILTGILIKESVEEVKEPEPNYNYNKITIRDGRFDPSTLHYVGPDNIDELVELTDGVYSR